MPSAELSKKHIDAALAKVFGYKSFRPYQEEIVSAILNGKDTFTLMPTGAGKSLCYQLPAYLLDGVCVVVSPLISLMKDQVDAACANGLKAVTLNSTTLVAERRKIAAMLHNNELNLLYVSPERLNVDGFIEYLKQFKISFFAVDEAHCISQWGHDFRPDYLALSRIAQDFPHTSIAAFTATATSQVATDIITRLALRNPHRVCASFNRPNLYYQVTPKAELSSQLLSFLSQHKDEAGIIYRITRKQVDSTAAMLKSHGYKAMPYHAGLSDKDRAAAQEDFRLDKCQLVVATIAFGMGIDKSNVRFVIHADMPKNIEGYYQETGRAGRDSEPAFCLMLYKQSDVVQLLRFADDIEDETQKELTRKKVFQMLDFAQNDVCRRKSLLGYFGENYSEDNCHNCDICLGHVEREDATINAQKVFSAMKRTGERFGAGHIIDIVTGSETQKIFSFQHNELPTYGVGKDKDKKYWRLLIDNLLLQGFLEKTESEFPSLIVSAKGMQLLKGSKHFFMIKQSLMKKDKKSQQNNERANTHFDEDENLFLLLKQARYDLAQKDKLPPYVIFHDTALREMAKSLPDTDEKFLLITGVGESKLKKYGKLFMDIIKDYSLKQ